MWLPTARQEAVQCHVSFLELCSWSSLTLAQSIVDKDNDSTGRCEMINPALISNSCQLVSILFGFNDEVLNNPLERSECLKSRNSKIYIASCNFPIQKTHVVGAASCRRYHQLGGAKGSSLSPSLYLPRSCEHFSEWWLGSQKQCQMQKLQPRDMSRIQESKQERIFGAN